MKKLELSKETNERMKFKIMEYFEKEYDDILGEIAALQLLDLIIKEIGVEIYNEGIADAQKHMLNSIEDLYAIKLTDKKK